MWLLDCLASLCSHFPQLLNQNIATFLFLHWKEREVCE